MIYTTVGLVTFVIFLSLRVSRLEKRMNALTHQNVTITSADHANSVGFSDGTAEMAL